jgi:hypothetical protein
MADEAPLLFRKRLGALYPANPAATEALRAIDDRPVRVRITQTRGNVRRNGLYWIVLGIAVPMLEERMDGPLTVPMLHRILKRKGGLAKPVTLPSGEVEWDYDSISFAKMPEPKRAEYIDWAIRTLASWLGCAPEDLRHEGEKEAA